MHDLRMIREQVDTLREGMRRRGKLDTLGPIIDRAQSAEVERRALIQAVEERKASRNSISQEVARRKKAGESADDLLAQSRNLGEEISQLEGELGTLQSQLTSTLFELPNVTLDEVPEGGEDANTVQREWGTPREKGSAVPHWEIGTKLGLIDFERGAKISGSGFILYRGL